jgi:hypothetical protein
MKPQYFKFTRDLISSDDPDRDMTGVCFRAYANTHVERLIYEPADVLYTQIFQVYDDDDELCYEGVATEDVDYHPLGWASWNAGATRIEYQNPNTGSYETL